MNNAYNNHLIKVRAKALLTISLTSRNDLILSELNEDYGFEFLVRILKDGSPTNRMFGIELKASAQVTEGPMISLQRDHVATYKDIPFPLCLFFFSMHKDRGYYAWLVEPRFSPQGKPELVVNLKNSTPNTNDVRIAQEEFIELSTESLEHLVDTVNSWYDARQL